MKKEVSKKDNSGKDLYKLPLHLRNYHKAGKHQQEIMEFEKY